MSALALGENQVHIWTIDLDKSDADFLLLTHSEISRASRFVDMHKRLRFITARSTLRKVLSYYLDNDTVSEDFNYNPSGKPFLRRNTDLAFNMSYSKNIAMIAVSIHRDVGIDIQAIELVIDPESVAEQVCSSSEIADLLALNVLDRQNAFAAIWVRKEAYIKALGTGMSRGMHTFSVSSATGDVDALSKDEMNHVATKEWRLTYINAPNGYTAAVAAKGRNWHCVKIEIEPNLFIAQTIHKVL